MRRRAAIVTGVSSLMTSSGWVRSQPLEEARPLRLIIPFGPGSGVDAIGRTLAQQLPLPSISSVVVENREGASGSIGAKAVAVAAPDGYTLLLAANPPFAVTPLLQKAPGYHPVQDFTAIARLAEMPMVLVASRHSTVGSFSELIAYTKRHPGRLDYASAGVGVPSHLFMEQLKGALGLDLTFIPYKSTGQMYTDVISGQVPLATVSLGVAAPHIASGAWRPLTIGLAQRHVRFPDVPTIREVSPAIDLSGNMKIWYGLLGPRELPRKTAEAIYVAVARTAQSAAFSATLNAQFAELALQDPQAFSGTVTSNYEMNRKLIDKLGLTATV